VGVTKERECARPTCASHVGGSPASGYLAPPYLRMMLRAEGRGRVLLPKELVTVTHGMDPTAPRLCVASLLARLTLAAEQARAARNSRFARAWIALAAHSPRFSEQAPRSSLPGGGPVDAPLREAAHPLHRRCLGGCSGLAITASSAFRRKSLRCTARGAECAAI